MLSSIYRIEGDDLLRGYGFDMLKSGEGKGDSLYRGKFLGIFLLGISLPLNK